MKISKPKFVAHLRENGGLYSQTAKAISKETGEPYSRQAVKDRAEKLPPELLEDIRAAMVDVAEGKLKSLIEQDDDKRVSLEASKFYLNSQGKKRGYGDDPEEVSALPGKIIVEVVKTVKKRESKTK